MHSLIFFVFSAVIVQVVTSERETHRLIHVQNGVEVVQDIVHDMEDNTVTVTVSQTPAFESLIPTLNYHDFDTRFVVFKDIQRGLCLLTEAPIPFATPDIYKLKTTNITLPYEAEFDSSPLSSDEVESIAGKKLRDFCQDYTTLRMHLTPERRISERDVWKPKYKKCFFNCGICSATTSSPGLFQPSNHQYGK